ncbi:MAG: SHOCT domain-containing protein, partial [Rhizobium sp.]|nr:SHOCT domain-containing protein [Rhizobium sp.]
RAAAAQGPAAERPEPPVVSRYVAPAPADAAATHTLQAEPIYKPDTPAASVQDPSQAAAASASAEDDIFAKIERLAVLHGKGILTDEEFSTKKADLLGRL